jgi:hypothetical protein
MARTIGKTWTRKSPRLKQKRSDGLIMEELTGIEALSSVIQLAVAPVFLLAGIAGLLNVLSVRLDRAVDRVRVVETALARNLIRITLQFFNQGSLPFGVEYA